MVLGRGLEMGIDSSLKKNLCNANLRSNICWGSPHAKISIGHELSIHGSINGDTTEIFFFVRYNIFFLIRGFEKKNLR